MLSVNQNDPKVVTIRICRAEDLKFNSDKKKKVTTKWRVVFISGSKKKCSDGVNAPDGNPRWDCEVNLKLNSRHEPISLLVMDSEEHHVGQVILPLTQIKALPADHDPWATHKIIAATLEPTKKNSYPSGCLYFWAYVAEYHLDAQAGPMGALRKKSSVRSGGSMQSLNILSKSKTDIIGMFRKSSEFKAPAVDGLEKPVKQKKGRFWSKKKKGGGGDDREMCHSMFDLSGGGGSYLGGMSVTSDIRLDGEDSSQEEAGSSILGGSSGIGSEAQYSHLEGGETASSRSQYDSPMRQTNGSLGRTGGGALPPAGPGHYHTGSAGRVTYRSRPSVSNSTFVKNQRRPSTGMMVMDIEQPEGVHGAASVKRTTSSKLSKTDSGIGAMGRRNSSFTDILGAIGSVGGGGNSKHRRDPSDAGSESGQSHMSGSKSLWSLSKPKRNSSNKKDIADLNKVLRSENDVLANQLMEAQRTESDLRDRCTTLKSQLTSRERDVERLSRSLCDLKNRLLSDGYTNYLEKAI